MQPIQTKGDLYTLFCLFRLKKKKKRTLSLHYITIIRLLPRFWCAVNDFHCLHAQLISASTKNKEDKQNCKKEKY